MRADMFKVAVERPRRGGGDCGARLYRASDELPPKIGMRRGYRSHKSLNENLAPLRRYLHAQVGRPWNSVYSEVCRTIDVRSTVKQHIRGHIEDFVLVNTRWVDGQVMGPLWRRSEKLLPLAELAHTFYVHPRNGLLMRNEAPDIARRRLREARSKREQEAAADRQILDDRRQLHRIDGLWFLVELAPLPLPTPVTRCVNGKPETGVVCEARWDVLRKALVSRANGNAAIYAVSKRQLSRREARRYGV